MKKIIRIISISIFALNSITIPVVAKELETPLNNETVESHSMNNTKASEEASSLLMRSNSLRGAEVEFESEVLEKVIREKLGIAEGTPILSEDMDSLTRITITVAEVTSLKGLEYATNLEQFEINAPYNSLTKLDNFEPLSNLTKLRSLVFQSSLEVSDTSHLKNLGAQIDIFNLGSADLFNSMDFLNSFTNLRILSLRSTYLSEKFVDLSGVTSLPNLQNASFMYINFNDTLNLGAFPKIKELDFRETDIKSLDNLAAEDTLELLHLTSNFQLENVDSIATHNKLYSIMIVQSYLISDLEFVATLDNLNQLVILQSSVSDLSPLTLSSSSFEDLTVGISKVEDISMIGSINLALNAHLNLTSNKITDISSLKNIELNNMKLTISSNQITDFTPLNKYHGRTDIVIDATSQYIVMDDTFVGDPNIITFRSYDGSDLFDKGDSYFAKYTFENNTLTWLEETIDYLEARVEFTNVNTDNSIPKPNILNSIYVQQEVGAARLDTITTSKDRITYYTTDEIDEEQFFLDVNAQSIQDFTLKSDFQNVDFSVVSDYLVTINTTDMIGRVVTKEVTVSIIEKTEPKPIDPVKPEAPKDKETVDTGVFSNSYITFIIISLITLFVLYRRKLRSTNNY